MRNNLVSFFIISYSNSIIIGRKNIWKNQRGVVLCVQENVGQNDSMVKKEYVGRTVYFGGGRFGNRVL